MSDVAKQAAALNNQIARSNFTAEVTGLASFYDGRIPMEWQDKLEELLDAVEKGTSDDAAD